MPRKAEPWYDAEKDVWRVYVNRKRFTLAKGKDNRLEALMKFRELTAPKKVQPKIVVHSGQQICKLFLEHAKANLKPNTYDGYKRFLEPFGKTVRTIDADDVLPKHVSAFVNSHAWGKTTRFNAITAIKRAWSWAKAECELNNNQIAKMDRPRPKRRDQIPDEQEIALFMKHANPAFRELLKFIHLTGCRPGEAAMIERRHVNLVHHEVRFGIGEDKTSGKTDKPRVIHLTNEALLMLAERLKQGATGPLFRNTKGRPWTRFAMSCATALARKRTGLDSRAVVYALRHHWATDALAKGVPLSTVAEMMGNSPEIVARVYSHLSDKKQLLLDAANTVRPSHSEKLPTGEPRSAASAPSTTPDSAALESRRPA